jgi:glycine/sarcosine N-methyltransferase
VSAVPLWDYFSADYDRFINWEERLARELPFLEARLIRHGARRLLDVACGTGHHAIALAQGGYEVVGTDVSEGMVNRARENAGAAGVSVTFRRVGFGQLAQTTDRHFDAILCLGNSLPGVLSEADLLAALADMAALLAPGGLLIVQNLNYDRVWPRQERFMPLESYRDGQEEWLFFRFVDFHPETLTFNMVVFHGDRGLWDYQTEATELRPIFSEDLNRLLEQSGFGAVDCYGDYDENPCSQETSGDLIVVAKKA